jgi:hypothetical protein
MKLIDVEMDGSAPKQDIKEETERLRQEMIGNDS